MGKAKIGEWLWRFLAVAMMFAVAWAVWIFYQIHPPALITHAAFEAAASAHARQNSQGLIAPASAAERPGEAPKEPAINAGRLKLSDSLSEKK